MTPFLTTAPFASLDRVRTPRLARWCARVLLLLFGAAPFSLALVPWQQTVRGRGQVRKWHVVEGSWVKTGDRIVDIDDNDPKPEQRLQAQRKFLLGRLDSAKGEVDEQTAAANEAENALAAAVKAAEANRDAAALMVKVADEAVKNNDFALGFETLRAKMFADLHQDRRGLASRIEADEAKARADRALTDLQLRRSVAAGRTRNIERTDNQQNIALRNGLLIQAERGFQQATIDLSLFLRDAAGNPTLAGPERLPPFPEAEPIDPTGFDAVLAAAVDQRPEPRRLRLLRDKVAVELELAVNQNLPTLNAVGGVSQDAGKGKSTLSGPNGLERTTLTAGLAFSLPVQRRDARGRAAAAQAQPAQLDQQLRQAEDAVRADVQDAFSALERAYAFLHQASARVALARDVASAERAREVIGDGDVLRITCGSRPASRRRSTPRWSRSVPGRTTSGRGPSSWPRSASAGVDPRFPPRRPDTRRVKFECGDRR